jgi:peptidoglycan/LPS O-acetylase OafA/YrhL
MRAIAVGLVVIFHFRLLPLGEAGFIGVDIFFVISGFLITRILMDGLGENRFRLAGFYLARIRRLYPAMLATMVLYLAVAYVLFLPDQFRELSIETLLSQLYVVNFYFWREVNYFGLHAKDVPLLHMWSLAIEEQFYIFYPLFLMAVWRFARTWLIPLTILVVLASFALGWVASVTKPWAAFYLLPTRAWELGAGGLLAMALARPLTIRPITAQAAGIMGIGLIALTIVLHRPDIAWPGWLAALPVAASMALILAGSGDQKGLVTRLLSTGPFLWVGRISYPLYLVHWPVLIVLQESLPDMPWGWRAFGLALSVLLAWAIWAFIETPIRKGRILKGTTPFMALAGGVSVVLIAVSVFGYRSGGLPDRFSPAVLDLLAYADDNDERINLAECSWPKTGQCRIGKKDATPRVGIIGDSHAWAFANGFDQWLNAANQSGTLMFGAGCMPVDIIWALGIFSVLTGLQRGLRDERITVYRRRIKSCSG